MKQFVLVAALLAAPVLSTLAADNFAAEVIDYHPGTGFAPGFTNASAVLGAPAATNPFGEAVDPFNPPYGTNQVLSIGTGGSLTIKLQKPIPNAPRRAYGMDFIIFGNSGFIITNEFDLETFEWIGTPATDGSLFAANAGATRISVSRNGRDFFPLDPERAPNLDALFPSDSAGRFDLPVPPLLAQEDFAGATLDDIRELYRGSAGGAAYDLAWAIKENGRRARPGAIRYVRVEVVEGKIEIDAFSATARRVPRAQR